MLRSRDVRNYRTLSSFLLNQQSFYWYSLSFDHFFQTFYNNMDATNHKLSYFDSHYVTFTRGRLPRDTLGSTVKNSPLWLAAPTNKSSATTYIDTTSGQIYKTHEFGERYLLHPFQNYIRR